MTLMCIFLLMHGCSYVHMLMVTIGYGVLISAWTSMTAYGKFLTLGSSQCKAPPLSRLTIWNPIRNKDWKSVTIQLIELTVSCLQTIYITSYCRFSENTTIFGDPYMFTFTLLLCLVTTINVTITIDMNRQDYHLLLNLAIVLIVLTYKSAWGMTNLYLVYQF